MVMTLWVPLHAVQLMQVEREPAVLEDCVSSKSLSDIFPPDFFKPKMFPQPRFDHFAFRPIFLSIQYDACPFLKPSGHACPGYNFASNFIWGTLGSASFQLAFRSSRTLS